MNGHFIVCGTDSTAARVVEELRAVDEQVVAIVTDPELDHAPEIAALGARMVVAPAVTESALRTASVSTALGLALVATDDIGNVHGALTAEELNPDLRLVVHIIDPRLGRHLETLIDGCTSLSAAAISAPEFVSAALEESGITWVNVADRDVVAGSPTLLATPSIATLARTSDRGLTEVLPGADTGDLVLSSGVRQAPPRRMPPWLDDLVTDVARVFDRRMQVVALAMALFVAIGSVTIYLWPQPAGRTYIDPLDALYLAIGLFSGTGISDAFTEDAPAWGHVLAVSTQLVGLVLIALLTAAIVDAYVGSSLAATSLGRVRGRPRGHVIVTGLGTVGTRVLTTLHERGFNVIAIERNPARAGVETAHRLRIPVLIGDVSNDEYLYQARIHRALAVIAVTSNDVANLEVGLYAKERNTNARVVLRLFDHDLANRVTERLQLGATRSVSMLVAPAFVRVLLRRRVDATVPAGRRVLRVTEVPVEEGSSAIGSTVSSLESAGSVQVLAYRPVNGVWDWSVPRERVLAAGDMVALVASAAGLARSLLATRSGLDRSSEAESTGMESTESTRAEDAGLDAAESTP